MRLHDEKCINIDLRVKVQIFRYLIAKIEGGNN